MLPILDACWLACLEAMDAHLRVRDYVTCRFRVNTGRTLLPLLRGEAPRRSNQCCPTSASAWRGGPAEAARVKSAPQPWATRRQRRICLVGTANPSSTGRAKASLVIEPIAGTCNFISPTCELLLFRQERISIIRGRDKRLFDRTHRHPANQIEHRSRFVVSAACSGSTEWLLAHDGASWLVIDIEVPRGVTKSLLGFDDDAPIRRKY